MIGIAVLGSTGSIGVSTLDVVRRHPQRMRVVALSAHRNVERMADQCRAVKPRYAVMVDAEAAARLRAALADMRDPPEVLAGAEALEEIATLPEVDYVMAAIVGAAGLLSTLAAAKAGKRLLLANKEALVVAGAILMRAVVESGAELLPIDSEHNAIFQCLPPQRPEGLAPAGVERILLTASGGPFRNTPAEDLLRVTPDQACAHPNWSMGRKISVDSATMMNKGLEIIEACWLFDTPPERIQVVVHPQSVIHSMVQYNDGSVLAQLGNPDMRTPIAHALAWPERIASGVEMLDLFAVARLDFEPPAPERFPCLRLAYRAASEGGTAPVVLNAANEVAVAAFLDGDVGFTDIGRIVEMTMDQMPVVPVEQTDMQAGLNQVLEVDAQARALARQSVASLGVSSGARAE
ncbi:MULTISPECIES: 1-deoxy-D-xylulose-5-phosphate reductoisomerase [Thiorhodovibrio]|uniref:1-deoxy-D-xylulose-5-phosphate reductoisomerase n=1 Tax=Thiorhodovibrio TaxID=61593 RepID=UPI001914AD04|nr:MULTISPECIES: 1-deoxy-D-xylulose-5-phosphate reductoisomerase [Thiorhodovibrio]MBK5968709.1 1-deoxy-D-xylulose-5-phosphate reductoisomerase [Thiorhodovibrio winogradskyi]WPL10933.1 1-deoxy-D-xylulose 5-phosphate reductoisomerase [Thiorhodovibrio litoralis]